jgi:hypothetical protein
MLLRTGPIRGPVESCVLTEMDARDSIILSMYEACCRLQLLGHMLSPMHLQLQYIPVSFHLELMRGTYRSRHLVVSSFYVGSIIRWLGTRYIFYW